MIVLAFSAFLFLIAGVMLFIAARRKDGSAKAATREAWLDFARLMPRLAVGVIGAGFIAKAMPHEPIQAWLGPSSGFSGLFFAAVAGGLTPGGPVVGFAIGAAALKAGAGLPQVMAYVTGWSLYTINRLFVWEVPSMPPRMVWLRLAASLPFPFLVGGLAMLLPP
jgi:uncharacterized membrane protein YraQ (UPF0718 family)